MYDHPSQRVNKADYLRVNTDSTNNGDIYTSIMDKYWLNNMPGVPKALELL